MPTVDRETKSFLVMGFLQASLSLWLLTSTSFGNWPATQPTIFVPIFMVLVLAPLAFYVSTAAPLVQRWKLSLMVAVLVAPIGIYQAMTSGTLPEPWLPRGPGTNYTLLHLSPMLLLALVILIALPAASVSRRWRVPYGAWMDALLHSILVVTQATFVTMLFWAVLLSMGLLLRVVGVTALMTLISGLNIPITALVFSYGVSLAAKNRATARFMFDLFAKLCGWIYPMAGLLGIAFALSLCVQGVQPLLNTKWAAFLLMWFATLCVLLVNCSSRGGLEAPPYPRWMYRILSSGLVILLPIAVLAIYSLMLRIEQHGLTEDRFWGLFVALVLLVFSVGYAVNAALEWTGRPERSLVPGTNAFAAAVVVMGVLLMVSGVIDPRRLSVNDQLRHIARSQADEGSRIRYLAREGAIFGRRALEELAAQATAHGQNDDIVKRHAAQAREVLMPRSQLAKQQGDLLHTLAVVPTDASVPAALLKAMEKTSGFAGCSADLDAPTACLIWRLPEQLGISEAYVVLGRTVDGNGSSGVGKVWLFNQKGNWQSVGQLHQQGRDIDCRKQEGSSAVLFDAVRAGSYKQVAKQLKDIEAGGLRFALSVWRTPGCD